MPVKRMTAKKVRVCDIMSGKWVKKEGMEPSYVQTGYGDTLSRVRIMGTVVSKFAAEDGNFASITIDDSTETMRIKTFKTVKPLDTVVVGDIVDVIGKIREYNEEIYMIPEIVVKVADPNLELLRRLEVVAEMKAWGAGEKKAESEPEAEKPNERDNIRRLVLEKIEANPEGVSYTKIMGMISAPEEDIELVINDLLAEGICYEPSPGKIRKI